MIRCLAISGGAHLCVSYIGFLRSIRREVDSVRHVSACSAGAIVAICWILDLPDDAVMRIIGKNVASGVLIGADYCKMMSSLGVVNSAVTIGAMCRDLLEEGVRHYRTIVLGSSPEESDGVSGEISLLQLAKLTGKSISIGVCDASDGFRGLFLSADTHPDVPVWLAVTASSAIPVVFTPVKIAGMSLCDACLTGLCPTKGISCSAMADDTLLIETDVGASLAPSPLTTRSVGNIIDYAALVCGLALGRAIRPDRPPPARVATVPLWTTDLIGPMIHGIPMREILSAYRQGLVFGKQFLVEIISGGADEPVRSVAANAGLVSHNGRIRGKPGDGRGPG